jgi:nucleoside-diphosphate-sugar epimerase
VAQYLVTGGGGFIGSNLTESLLKSGDDVRVLDNFSSGRRENLAQAEQWAAAGGGAFHLLEGDIRELETCREAMAGVDYVMHEAAVPSVQRSVLDPLTTNDVNIKGTLNLLEEARQAGVKRFVYASSSSLYGESETLPKVESMPLAPISPYGLQKMVGEKYCMLYHSLYGLPTIALRYFNVFGQRQDPASDYAAVVPRFITAMKQGEPPTIYGDGEQTRDFTFIENVVNANRLGCMAGEVALGGAYNIGCGNRISLNALLDAIGQLVERRVAPVHAEPRPGDIRHSLAGIELAAERLSFKPTVGLAEGLRLTFEAY